MKKLLLGFITLALTLGACTPLSQTPTEPPSLIIEQPDSGSNDAPTKEALNPIEYIVIRQLSQNLDLSINDISVLENKATDFNDACLGISMQDVMCAQVVTPGHIIVLEANNIQYEYHTNNDGSQIQPATLALTWRREGGFAGFCDNLTVFLSGEIYGNQCKSQPNGTMGTFATILSKDEFAQFNSWIARYGEVTLDASDPKGVADGMMLVIELHGVGNGKPGKPVEGEIFSWAQDLFNKLYE